VSLLRNVAGAALAAVLMPVALLGVGAALYVAVIRALVVETVRGRRP